MKVIVVDDEYLALEGTMSGVRKVLPEADVRGLRDPSEVVRDVKEKGADVALLDIEMRTMDGMSLARELMQINPRINIIFTTGYREYMEDAFGIHVSGYVVKPITPEKLKAEFSHLRFPVSSEKKLLRVRTFGEFEVFVDEKPVEFSYAKTKELFALMIDKNGAMITIGTIEATLWEDEEVMVDHASYIRNLVADLTHVFREKGCEDVILRRRGVIGVETLKISCDYYDFLAGEREAARLAGGEYMSNYSWAEVTHASILNLLDE